MATITKVKKADGSTRYRVRVVVGHRPDGTAIQQMRTYATKRESESEGAKWEADVARGTAGNGARMLLGAYLAEWLERSARRVRPITLYGYRYLVDHYINPTSLASVPLGKLTPAVVQRWIDAMPHPATARKARAVLNSALGEATRLGLLPMNPVTRTTAPAHTPKVGTAWTADETRRFLEVAVGDPYAPFWQLAAYLGLRPSEIAGLRWDALDLDAAAVRVERARPTACGKTFASEDTKSPAGKRTLTLPPPSCSACAPTVPPRKSSAWLWGNAGRNRALSAPPKSARRLTSAPSSAASSASAPRPRHPVSVSTTCATRPPA